MFKISRPDNFWFRWLSRQAIWRTDVSYKQTLAKAMLISRPRLELEDAALVVFAVLLANAR